MEKSELIKYISFSLHNKDNKSDNKTEWPGEKLAFEKWGEYTFMIGHQPRSLTDEEIQANKIIKPNVICSFDSEDPYRTDDVGEPLGVNYSNLSLVFRGGCDVFETTVKICDKEFTIFIENDCGFATAYGSPEIYELIKQ